MDEWRKESEVRDYDHGTSFWLAVTDEWSAAMGDLKIYMPEALIDRILADHKAAEELAAVKAAALDVVENHHAILEQGAHQPGSPQQVFHWAAVDALTHAIGIPTEKHGELALQGLRKLIGGKIAEEQGKVIADLRSQLVAAREALRDCREAIIGVTQEFGFNVGPLPARIDALLSRISTEKAASEVQG